MRDWMEFLEEQATRLDAEAVQARENAAYAAGAAAFARFLQQQMRQDAETQPPDDGSAVSTD